VITIQHRARREECILALSLKILKPLGHPVEVTRHEPGQPRILVAGAGSSFEKDVVGLRENNLAHASIASLA